MKTRFIFASTVAALLFTAVSCSYDDTEIKGKVDELDGRVTKLEEAVNSINTNVGSLMTIVNALEKEVKIDKVVDLEDGSGHIIMFTDGSSITVTNGRDGNDGETPVISVGKDTDGLYYWKVNGDWLLDDGKRFRRLPSLRFLRLGSMRPLAVSNFRLTERTGRTSVLQVEPAYSRM